MKNTSILQALSYAICIASYVGILVGNYAYVWCLERPHYGVLSGRVADANEGFMLCLNERIISTDWNEIHYVGLLVLALLFFLLKTNAEAKKIYITFGIMYGICFLIMFLLSFIIIH